MFRTLSRTLTLTRRIPSPSAGSSRLLNHRRRLLSDRPADPLPPPDADPETDLAPPPPHVPEPEASPAVRRLEDAIHAVVVRRLAPDWLPFVPGSSYWVPPMRPVPVICISELLSNALSEEEVLSLTTVRGWPSSYYYLGEEEGLPTHEVKNSPEDTTDDEES